jgi:hypothetical protein
MYQATNRRKPTRINVDVSTETLKAMNSWNDVFQVLKKKELSA